LRQGVCAATGGHLPGFLSWLADRKRGNTESAPFLSARQGAMRGAESLRVAMGGAGGRGLISRADRREGGAPRTGGGAGGRQACAAPTYRSKGGGIRSARSKGT